MWKPLPMRVFFFFPPQMLSSLTLFLQKKSCEKRFTFLCLLLFMRKVDKKQLFLFKFIKNHFQGKGRRVKIPFPRTQGLTFFLVLHKCRHICMVQILRKRFVVVFTWKEKINYTKTYLLQGWVSKLLNEEKSPKRTTNVGTFMVGLGQAEACLGSARL